jgi:hypothetical protein
VQSKVESLTNREIGAGGHMSDLDTRPQEYLCGGRSAGGPEELLLTARRVPLDKTTEVSRALPDRQIRMIGAWCFLIITVRRM